VLATHLKINLYIIILTVILCVCVCVSVRVCARLISSAGHCLKFVEKSLLRRKLVRESDRRLEKIALNSYLSYC